MQSYGSYDHEDSDEGDSIEKQGEQMVECCLNTNLTSLTSLDLSNNSVFFDSRNFC